MATRVIEATLQGITSVYAEVTIMLVCGTGGFAVHRAVHDTRYAALLHVVIALSMDCFECIQLRTDHISDALFIRDASTT
jgi:hypothetical protein